MKRRLASLALFVTPLLGCSSAVDTSVAEAAVTGFHTALDTGNFLQIYLESSDDLKQATPQKDFLELLSAVHRKLGTTKTSTKQSWKVNLHTSGRFVELVYRTMYEKGEAIESFVYRVQDDRAALAGYHINSTALIVN